MAPSHYTELDTEQRQYLLQLARRSIASRLAGVEPEPEPDTDIPELPADSHGVFVTLTLDGQLRGCIGAMQPPCDLMREVPDIACRAAFRDPRFPPLSAAELSKVNIEIAVLSTPRLINAGSRAELLIALQPGVDGLLLEDGVHRATFLPKVWAQLPERAQFLGQLMTKAGLPSNHWSKTLRCSRYRSDSFAEQE